MHFYHPGAQHGKAYQKRGRVCFHLSLPRHRGQGDVMSRIEFISVIILHALILQTIPFELPRKPPTANWWALLLALPEGTSIYNNQYRPLFEVCPRDHGNVVGTLQGTDEASSYAIKISV